jgi:ElaB/YqjD/DUF883 family membrane-anchored ribosome-binding protein
MADEDDFHDIGDGGGGGDPQQPVQQPAVDLSPIEDRLNRITQAITGLTRDQETREVQSRINTVETQLRQRMTQAETAVTLAERKVAQAYDSGDGTQIARANRELTETIANRESIKADIREFDRYKKDADRQRPAPQTQQQPQAGEEGAKDTRNLNDWKTRNSSWYGVDADMTKAAHEVDKSIREAGVIPVGSQEYFKAIDRQMAQKYPDRFRSTPNTAGAGDGRQPAPQRQTGRIPQSVLDSWSRMGIDVNDNKTLERMVRNQQALVAKGILPQERQYGPVMTR